MAVPEYIFLAAGHVGSMATTLSVGPISLPAIARLLLKALPNGQW